MTLIDLVDELTDELWEVIYEDIHKHDIEATIEDKFQEWVDNGVITIKES